MYDTDHATSITVNMLLSLYIHVTQYPTPPRSITNRQKNSIL